MIRLASITLLVLLFAGSASAVQFGLDSLVTTDTVYFRSTASLEFIEGKTNHLEGSFSFDPNNVTDSIGGILRVDLRTLKTGIGTRDGHMRNKHLHTDKFPYAYFSLDSVSGLSGPLPFDTTITAAASGRFFIHGVNRKLEAQLTITRRATEPTGELLQVRVSFALKLDEYKIPRPKALFLKLAETIEVEVIFNGRAGRPVPAIMLPDWPEIR